MSLEAPDNTKAEADGLYGANLALAPVQEDASLGATTEQISINGPDLQTAERLQKHLGSKWTAP